MEETRIGAMYVNLVKRQISHLWDSMFPRGLMRSPALLVGGLAVLLIGPAVAWHLHRKGEFSRVKRKVHRELQTNTYSAGNLPGGLAPTVLRRGQTAGSQEPQFLSATVLPGLGMSVLQLTAYLPGQGETALLAAPVVAMAEQGASGPPKGVDDDSGALEVPWGGRLTGGLTPMGTISVNWKGHEFDIPMVPGIVGNVADGGLLRNEAVDESHVSEDGAGTVGVFHDSNFDGHWVTKTETTVSVQMAAQSLELTVQAKNTGDVPEPMGIGWHPRFEVVGGTRGQIQLRLPSGDRLQLADDVTAVPTGKTEAAGSSEPGLDTRGFDETRVNLKAKDDGVSVEMREPQAGFGLRMTALSTNVRAVRVVSPADASYVSLGMQTNLDDPFGQEWTGGDGSGMVTLEPGQTLEWKVKLEIFAVAKR